MEERVKQIVLSSLNIQPDAYTEDLAAGDIPQWDSFAHVNLLMEVEKQFNISFDVGDAIDIQSVGDLIEMVKKYTAASH